MKEIEATGNVVKGEIIINAKFGAEKKATSTFFVNLSPGPNIKAIKDLKFIYHQSMVIEDPRKRKSIIQCHMCQQYAYSKNYCMRLYRCVKSGQSQNTSECTKRNRNTALCALCNCPHPANYKGCEVYIEKFWPEDKNHRFRNKDPAKPNNLYSRRNLKLFVKVISTQQTKHMHKLYLQTAHNGKTSPY